MPWLTAALMFASACGYGQAILRICRYPLRSWLESCGFAFALGMGMIGWVVFFLGLVGAFHREALAIVLVPGLVAAPLALRGLNSERIAPPRGVTLLLLAGVGLSLCILLLSALAPPVEVDTLAYHFAIPKQLLARGRLTFMPLALEGAIPLLAHMTYLVALGLGGERALQLWVLIETLALIAAFYAVARRYLSRDWSLALALVLMTTPTLTYVGVAGSVEARTALFMLVATVAAADAVAENRVGSAVVAGMAAGFFAGSKYYGLFAVAAIGAVLLARRHPVRLALVFALAALVAGTQWYAWNWVHTGDPVFPALSARLGYPSSAWNPAVQDYFATEYHRLMALPINPLSLVLYPFIATLDPPPALWAGRQGLGPIALLALPWVLIGWRAFRGDLESRLWRMCIAATLFYVLWFCIPTNQLTRELLPIYPVGLLFAGTAATRAATRLSTLRPWLASVAFSLAVGLGVQVLYSTNYVPLLLGRENRAAFLRRSVSYADVAFWLNSHLQPDARVGNPARAINYLLDVPYVYVPPAEQTEVELHPGALDARTFAAQLEGEHITHLVVLPALSGGLRPSFGINYLTHELVDAGCAVAVATVPSYERTSRTLRLMAPDTATIVETRLGSDACLRNLRQ